MLLKKIRNLQRLYRVSISRMCRLHNTQSNFWFFECFFSFSKCSMKMLAITREIGKPITSPLKFVHKIGYYRRSKWLLSSALLAEWGRDFMWSLYYNMFNVSFTGTCVIILRRNLQASVRRNRIFWIFCMKSVELVVWFDEGFPVKGCSICARKRDKLYVGECMADNRDIWFVLFW